MSPVKPATPYALRLISVGAAFGLAVTAVHGGVTLESLLKEMMSYEAMARWPVPEFTCKQASSYDRGSTLPDQPGWFANTDQNQFIRDEQLNGRTERVMMDAAGPGCLIRFWLTTDRNKEGVIRIYLDGAPEPALVFPAYDLLRGDLNVGAPLAQPHPGYRPDANGGNNFYLPIPYAQHCKVTWEEKSQGARYYQINYRTYAAGTAVKTFTRADVAANRALIREVNTALLAPTVESAWAATAHVTGELPARGELVLKLPAGPQAVRALNLQVPSSLTEQQLRSLVLVMVCDGQTNIWCPVADFFGSGVGLNPVQSWYRTVTADGVLSCRWVMPYQSGAEFRLLNLSERAVSATLTTRGANWNWDDRTMYFHATWHHEAELRTPPLRDWNLVRIKGRGVYVGDTLALFNPVATWYGEGDEKIRVDDETFPSHFGTGTEDYYGYSYAPKPVHQTPFCGEPRLDQSQTQGHSTSIRSRNLDGIPFRQSLRFDLELISWKPTTLTYAATTYWYALAGATANRPPQPEAATLPVPTLADAIAARVPRHFPGAIEGEKLKVIKRSGDFVVREQDMADFDGPLWSSGAHLLVVPNGAGDFVELEVPAPDESSHQITLHLTQAPDYGQLRFWVNDMASAARFDGFGEVVLPASLVPLGAFQPTAGRYTLRIQVAGANPRAVGAKHLFGLDYIELVKP
jgi:hypothetical protein